MPSTPVKDADLSMLRVASEPASELGAPPHESARRRRRPTLVLGVLLLALCGAALYAVRSQSVSADAVQTVPIRALSGQPAPTPLSANGYVVAQRQASVASKGTGRVEYLGVQIGSQVRRGDLIARLQQDDVQATQHQALAQVDVAKAALANAEAELEEAHLQQTRTQALLSHAYVSQSEYDTASTRVRRAESVVRSATAAITAAEADVRSAQVLFDNTMIRAPFDGTVLKKFAEVGEVVAPMASSANSRGAVVLIADLHSLAVEAELSETAIAKIRVGQPSDITLDARPDTHYAGTVAQIVPTADRTKGTVLVKVQLLSFGPEVLPDMSAKVSFSSPPQEAVPPRFAVPATSLSTQDGHDIIYVQDGAHVRAIPIQRIEQRGDDAVIEGALIPGMLVLRHPPAGTSHGEPIPSPATSQ